MENLIAQFLKTDREKMLEIIEKYPRQIPAYVVADLFGMSPENLRIAIATGSESILGLCWQKAGKDNKGYAIPTAPFVRRWLNLKEI